MGIEFKYVHADLEFQGKHFKDVAVRYKGNSTYMMASPTKRSLKVDFNKFVKGLKLAGVTKLNFANNVSDPSWMNEVVAHRLFRDAGVPAPRTTYAKVFVTVPGKYNKQYFGLYSMVENVDDDFVNERFGSKKGALFKPGMRSPIFLDLGDDWKSYEPIYGPKTESTAEQQQRVIAFSKLVSKAGDAEFADKLGDFFDLDQLARFMAVTVYVSSMDSILGMGQNYYIYIHPKTQKFQFLPWDYDLSFGHFPMQGGQAENYSIHRPWQGENRFLERVFKVEAFKKLYLAKLDEFSKTIFKPERFDQQVDEIAPAIRPAVREESEQKLAQFDKVVAGEPSTSGGFAGFGQARKPIKGFVKPRTQSIMDQLAGKSEGEIPELLT
jgi:spore coat protein CotH